MRPYHPPRPSHGQPDCPRPGYPGPPTLPAVPMHPQLNPAGFPPPVPILAAAATANPMAVAGAAAANPFLALQLFGQAQQLQNLGFLPAAALQQQPPPFFPGGFPPNPDQFGAFPGPHAGFNGGGAFRPGGVGVGGSWPPPPMMGAAGKGCNNGNGGAGPGAPTSVLNVGGMDRNSSGGSCGEVNHTKNKSDGTSHFASENGGRNNTTDQRARFKPGRVGRHRRQFGPPCGRGKGRPFNRGRGRGSNNWRKVKSNFTSSESPASGGRCSDSPASGGCRKRPPGIYDANEVKQWLEARKKNYPTSVNINKKLSQSQSDGRKKDEEAQMRRQKLFPQYLSGGDMSLDDAVPLFPSVNNFTSSECPASGGRRSDSPASGGRRKRPPGIYDANEVKQWLEARKKNYPTSVNINEKLSHKDEEAQMRRQELKEVLAKQKELGFELPVRLSFSFCSNKSTYNAVFS